MRAASTIFESAAMG